MVSDLLVANTILSSRSSSSSRSSMATTNASPYPCHATLNITNFVSLDLNSSNYILWCAQMRNLIESQDLGGFISGETPTPLPLIPSLVTGVRLDQQIQISLTGSTPIGLFKLGAPVDNLRRHLDLLLIWTLLGRFGRHCKMFMLSQLWNVSFYSNKNYPFYPKILPNLFMITSIIYL